MMIVGRGVKDFAGMLAMISVTALIARRCGRDGHALYCVVHAVLYIWHCTPKRQNQFPKFVVNNLFKVITIPVSIFFLTHTAERCESADSGVAKSMSLTFKVDIVPYIS